MSVEIKEVKSKSDLKKFIQFGIDLYKDNPYFVPPMIMDEIETYSHKKNPAYENADDKIFLAYKNGHIAGRIVGINNKLANKKWGTNNLRFSWFETIDDYEVTKALFDAVLDWAKELGMDTITGPHGFCDLDPQGLLVEGFDQMATIASFYNHSYVKDLVERYGFIKDVDYVEYLSTPPYETGMPQKLIDTTEWIKKRYNYRILDYKTTKEYKARGNEIFELLEESFEQNYGTVPLTKKQVDYYVKKYIGFIHPELIKVVVDEHDTMIGFMITMPSLTKAYRKANGHMFPFGMFHLLKAIKTYETLDFYFAGVKKDYRGKGVDLLMVVEIVKSAMKLGFKNAESNQELELNSKVQAEWKFFNPVMHKRRRIYKLQIEG